MKKFVIVTGRSGVGKTFLTNRLVTAPGARKINVGDAISSRLKREGIWYPNRVQGGELFLRRFGCKELIRILEDAAEQSEYLIVDGLRLVDVYKALNRNHEVNLIALSSPDVVREKRLLARDGVFTKESPYDTEIDHLCERADVILRQGSDGKYGSIRPRNSGRRGSFGSADLLRKLEFSPFGPLSVHGHYATTSFQRANALLVLPHLDKLRWSLFSNDQASAA